jgi:glycosyltransferase involved in cell wall biosynthesis
MKIVYLINGLNGGGAAFPMVQVIGLMRERGHAVRVVAMLPQDGKAAQRLEEAGIPYALIGERRSDLLAPAVRLVRLLRRDRPDLLWTSLTRGTLYGQLAGRLLGLPVVSWQHSDYLKPFNLAVLRRTRRLTLRWVADSESVGTFARTSLGVAADDVDVWPPFVADPELPTALPWGGSGALRLGTLGRLHHSKQYAVLLRAFALARRIDPLLGARIELRLAGDGPELAPLQAQVAALGLQGAVHFEGFVGVPSTFLASLHGYVQTSLKEGFCIAAHEAMQAGLPVISTRVGELADSVRPGETGWLCAVGDEAQIAAALLAWASDPPAAAAMGRTARTRVLERYSRERFRAVGGRLLDRVARDVALGTWRGAGRRSSPASP